MSDQSSSAVGQSHSATPTPFAPDPTFDARWVAWIERGRAHDRAVRRKLRVAVIGLGIITLLAAVVYGVIGAL